MTYDRDDRIGSAQWQGAERTPAPNAMRFAVSRQRGVFHSAFIILHSALDVLIPSVNRTPCQMR